MSSRGRAAHAPLWPSWQQARPLDVLAVGENSLDRVCRLPEPPRFPGKSRLLGDEELPGGQVATAALACARLGLRTAYVGAVGDDAAAERVLAPLRAAGVDVSGVRPVPGARTRRALVLVEAAGGERCVLADRDPRLTLGADAVVEGRVRAARLLLLDGSEPALARALLARAEAAGTPVVLDLDDPQPPAAALARRAAFPILSESCARALAGGRTLEEGLRALAAPPVRMAVATRGVRGALACRSERSERSEGHDGADGDGALLASESFPVRVADTTGAGDAFHAGFAWALLRGLGAADVLRAAHATAALGCRGRGAQGGLPSAEELEAFLRDPGRSAKEDGHA